MNMTDPVADLLARIRNGYLAQQEQVIVPASRLKANIIKVLRDEGYINGFKLVREGGRAWISIGLKYDDNGNSIIRGIRRVSKPGRRMYVSAEKVACVRNNAGVAILSTSTGIITGRQAKHARVGGEYLCEVW